MSSSLWWAGEDQLPALSPTAPTPLPAPKQSPSRKGLFAAVKTIKNKHKAAPETPCPSLFSPFLGPSYALVHAHRPLPPANILMMPLGPIRNWSQVPPGFWRGPVKERWKGRRPQRLTSHWKHETTGQIPTATSQRDSSSFAQVPFRDYSDIPVFFQLTGFRKHLGLFQGESIHRNDDF